MSTAPRSPSAAQADASLAVAGELCWHAMATCRAVDLGLEALHDALMQATAHADAITTIALRLADLPDPRPAPSNPGVQS